MNNEIKANAEEINLLEYILVRLTGHTRRLNIESEEGIKKTLTENKTKWVKEFIISTN